MPVLIQAVVDLRSFDVITFCRDRIIDLLQFVDHRQDMRELIRKADLHPGLQRSDDAVALADGLIDDKFSALISRFLFLDQGRHLPLAHQDQIIMRHAPVTINDAQDIQLQWDQLSVIEDRRRIIDRLCACIRHSGLKIKRVSFFELIHIGHVLIDIYTVFFLLEPVFFIIIRDHGEIMGIACSRKLITYFGYFRERFAS